MAYPLQSKNHIYARYPTIITTHTGRLSSLFLLYIRKKNKRRLIQIYIHKSVKIALSTGIGRIRAVAHTTHSRLKIFDQIIFPTAISVSFLIAAITDVASSGIEVHTATILAPIRTVETSKVRASDDACDTSASQPTYSQMTPRII